MDVDDAWYEHLKAHGNVTHSYACFAAGFLAAQEEVKQSYDEGFEDGKKESDNYWNP